MEKLSVYLNVLKEKKQEALKAEKRGKFSMNGDLDPFNFPEHAWDELNKKKYLPFISTKKGKSPAPYKNRLSGLGRSVPNICLKVPTGGGKTLLGAAGIERINTFFLEQNTGFVLWVTPSETIYKQTLRSLSDRESLQRQILDRASLGRVKILQKTDRFHPQDTKQYLCVMLLMLQSAGRQSKESLRIFKDSAQFPYFFPEVDAYYANEELIKICNNLDVYESSNSFGNVSIKHSLGNVLKIIQPLIVIDEGHRAYTEKAKKAFMDFNPRFVLELSATPNKKEHHSNILVSVSGRALKKEEMIKLPVNIFNLKGKNWKQTLGKGYEVLQSLSGDAIQLYEKENRYIRPIMLIRVERTGKDQRGKQFIHSEDVREYLIENLNVVSGEIKVKSSVTDELGQTDLLSEYSQVKYIITKEALKEGWDCPFAYVLVILSKTKAPVAIEQMIGRVLRQPHTKRTGIEALNQCYVVCMDQDVAGAVKGVQKGLQQEGMEGLAEDIKSRDGQQKSKREIKSQRKKRFEDLNFSLPEILYKRGKKLRAFSYEKDLLYSIDWSGLKPCKNLSLDGKSQTVSYTQVDIKTEVKSISSYQEKDRNASDFDVDFGFMCQRLSDIIPNPWDATVVVSKTLSFLKKKYGEKRLYDCRFYILHALRKDLQKQVNQMTEKIFREKIKNQEIVFNFSGNNLKTKEQLFQLSLQNIKKRF